MIRTLIYLVIFLTWLRTLTYDVLYVHLPFNADQSWLRKLKFLTMLNMVVQTVYFGLNVVRALMDRCKEVPKHGPHTAHPAPPTYYFTTKFHGFCDYFYSMAIFPLGMAVCIMFWALYAIDRELIFPAELDLIIPAWMNHVLHTAPVPFILVDTLLMCHKYPKASIGYTVTFVLGVIYCFSLLVWKYFEGYWAYPIFDVLSDVQRIVFFMLASLLFVVFYAIGDKFNKLVWGPASHPLEYNAKKKV